ncbi:TPA_asm: N [Ipomoea betacytorhabdovirus 1]|nr:TPA_asm: N [Ipomoea betacytorhabdovirus 1]
MTSRYENVDIPENTSTQLIAAEKWDNEVLSPSKTYTVRSNMKKVDLNRVVNYVLTSMSGETCSHNEVKAIVTCMHHLPDNLDTGYKSLLEHGYPSGELEMNFDTSKINSPITQKKTSKRKEIVSTEKTEEEKKMTPEQLTAAGLIQDPFDENRVDREEEREEVVEDVAILNAKDYSDNDLKYLIFAISFVVKVIGRGEDNLTKSWGKMNESFGKFFSETSTKITPLRVPNRKWFVAVKSKFNSDITLTRTVLRAIVYLERELAPETSTAGMVRYLFCLPLSCTGMHAYKLFTAVKVQSGYSNKYLLNALVHPSTVAALDEIVNILRNYESTTTAKKDPSFKYARLAGPQYFQALQTKACPALVYCLVKLLKKYEKSTSNYDPEGIIGVQGLSDEIKATMSRAAEIIYSAPPTAAESVYSPAMRAATFEDKAENKTEPTKGVVINPWIN